MENHGSQIDRTWMLRALEEARQANLKGEVPVGAIAVFKGAVIGRGYNSKESLSDPTAHAEVLALREAAKSLNNWRLVGVTLYCTLEPCAMCAGAMIQARLTRLIYGAKDIRFGADGSVVDLLSKPHFNHEISVTPGVLEEESAALLQSFFRSLRLSD